MDRIFCHLVSCMSIFMSCNGANFDFDILVNSKGTRSMIDVYERIAKY